MANTVEPDQMLHPVGFDLGLHCLLKLVRAVLCTYVLRSFYFLIHRPKGEEKYFEVLPKMLEILNQAPDKEKQPIVQDQECVVVSRAHTVLY